MSFKFEDFKAEKPTTKDIWNQFMLYNRWELLMSKSIPNLTNCGIMQLVGRRLREDLSNKVANEMENLREHLIKTANAQLVQIDQGIKGISKNLAAKTDTLAEFAKFTGAVKDAQNQRESLLEKRKDVDEIKTALVRFRNRDAPPSSLCGQPQILQLQQKLEVVTMQLTQTGSSLDNEISGAMEKTKNHIESN